MLRWRRIMGVDENVVKEGEKDEKSDGVIEPFNIFPAAHAVVVLLLDELFIPRQVAKGICTGRPK
jgi:hypothetical protein